MGSRPTVDAGLLRSCACHSAFGTSKSLRSRPPLEPERLSGRIQQGASAQKSASEQTAGGKVKAEKRPRARQNAWFEGLRALNSIICVVLMDRRRKNNMFYVVPKLPRAGS